MIQIKEQKDCCGCESCRQICPKQCISMVADAHGFCYPHVDTTQCINCHLCEQSCPVLQKHNSRILSCYAMRCKEEDVRTNSSSGGIFSLLAQHIIEEKGIVFGARFDKQWNVEHSFSDSLEGATAFRGSKYVQSRIGDCFKTVKAFLCAKYKVLFSGTPCQIAGLNSFLHEDYENLICVEVACHGVPSPMVWKDYVSKVGREGLCGISFRNKSISGWRKYTYEFKYANKPEVNSFYGENLYSDGFLNNFTLRPSCFSCPAKLTNSCADITIGDFWGVEQHHPDMDDDRGVSAVIIHTRKGLKLVNVIDVVKQETTLKKILLKNSAILKSTWKPLGYTYFWKAYSKYGLKAIQMEINQENHPSITRRIAYHIK